jgi:hypothetical protein
VRFRVPINLRARNPRNLGDREPARKCLEAPTGIEPVGSSSHAVERILLGWIERQVADAVALYRPVFESRGVV